jgi:hypothetical protein
MDHGLDSQLETSFARSVDMTEVAPTVVQDLPKPAAEEPAVEEPVAQTTPAPAQQVALPLPKSSEPPSFKPVYDDAFVTAVSYVLRAPCERNAHERGQKGSPIR